MRLILLLFLALACFSCKKTTYYIKSIENRTETTIHVGVFRTVLLQEEEFFSLKPGETRTFSETQESGLNRLAPDCYMGFDSLRLRFKDNSGRSYPVRINYRTARPWRTNTAEPDNFVEHSCVLVIDSSNLYTVF